MLERILRFEVLSSRNLFHDWKKLFFFGNLKRSDHAYLLHFLVYIYIEPLTRQSMVLKRASQPFIEVLVILLPSCMTFSTAAFIVVGLYD